MERSGLSNFLRSKWLWLAKITSIILLLLILPILSTISCSALSESYMRKFSASHIIFYDPDEEENCIPSSSSSSGGTFASKTYDYDDAELCRIASAATTENNCSINSLKDEMSLMANRAELDKKSSIGAEITGGWFAPDAVSAYNGGSSCDPELLEAARDVIKNGNRTVPNEIIEHDCRGDITYLIDGNGVRHDNNCSGDCCGTALNDDSLYVPGKTEIFNAYGAHYIFYGWAGGDPGCDPLGYTPDRPPTNTGSTTTSSSTSTSSSDSNSNSSSDTIDFSGILSAKNADKSFFNGQPPELSAWWSDTDPSTMKRLLENYGDLAYQLGKAVNIPWVAVLVQMRYEDHESDCGTNNFWGNGCDKSHACVGCATIQSATIGEGFVDYAKTLTNGLYDAALGESDPKLYLEKIGPWWVDGKASGDGYGEISAMKRSVDVLQKYIDSEEGQAIVKNFGNYTGSSTSSSRGGICGTGSSSGNGSISGEFGDEGLTYEQALQFMINYGANANNSSADAVGELWNACNGGGSNCSTFSAFFLNKFTSTNVGSFPGNGYEVVGKLGARGVPTGTDPKVFSVFSWSNGGNGHTGVILGYHDGEWIVGHASCSNPNIGAGNGTLGEGGGSGFVLKGSDLGYALYGNHPATYAYVDVNTGAISDYLASGGTK